jgi:hypothetical protein
MARPEFMRIPLHLIPPEIGTEYNLQAKAHSNHVYIGIDKGMYGLPQAGMLANKLLETCLRPHGYYQMRHTSGLRRHTTKNLAFTHVVDDLAIKHTSQEGANHLLNLLRKDYEGVSVDWDAS